MKTSDTVTIGSAEPVVIGQHARTVLESRYLRKDAKGQIVESPDDLFDRVAAAVAEAERCFKSGPGYLQTRDRFRAMMQNLDFLPNSPTLMNAGTSVGQLAACYVLPLEDSLHSIFGALHDAARIHQSGGGTGFDFSPIRPAGDTVSSTQGPASGPVSFMEVFDHATGAIIQGGKRRGANMAVLRCDHPDIQQFVEAKIERDELKNFNLSVGVTGKFVQAIREDSEFDLVNPHSGKPAKSIRAVELFNSIVEAAWRTGDPGLVFLDEINAQNSTPQLGPICATNPCGEVPLLPYECCTLGSINLKRMVAGGEVAWDKLRTTVHAGIRFLDDVVEVNKYPVPEVEWISRGNRKIGLGVMGFADMLILLEISYRSTKARGLAEKVMSFIHTESLRASTDLARERGPFPNIDRSVYAHSGMSVRNATVNSVAPTGSISLIAGCTSGIEPIFSLALDRTVLSGKKMHEVYPMFRERAESLGLYNEALLHRIGHSGSIQGETGLPQRFRDLFVTAFDTSPEQHVHIQAAFQRFTDNAVSKTVNLPESAGTEDVRKAFLLAYMLKCKGVTVYRYGCKHEQVLNYSRGEVENRRALLSAGCDADGCDY